MKLILVSHSEFANGIRSAVDMIIGANDDVVAFGLMPGNDMDVLEGKINDYLKDVPENEEILVLSDMFFGSPFNTVVRMMMNGRHFYHVTGMNLAMVLEAVSAMGEGASAKEIGEGLIESGREGILSANQQYNIEY